MEGFLYGNKLKRALSEGARSVPLLPHLQLGMFSVHGGLTVQKMKDNLS